MSILEDVVESVSPNVWVTAGLVLLTPIILPLLRTGLRPVVKGTVKGYLTVQDKVKELAVATGEQFSDMVAEAKSEHAAAVATAAGATEAARVTAPKEGEEKPKSRPAPK